MYSKFEGMDEKKKQRILNAAMKEFAARGYDGASTNRIVEDAGIAKGLLFHYFKSKEQLFLYLYDYGLALATRELPLAVDLSEKDFFRRVKKAQLAKLRLLKVYPDLTDFLKTAYLEESHTVKKELDARTGGAIAFGFQTMFEGIDTTLFRKDLDLGETLKTIAWAYQGLGDTLMKTLRRVSTADADYDGMLAEFDRYTEFLKKCFYLNESNGEDTSL